VTSPHPIRLVALDELRRNRLTVFFRLILAIPHFVWAFAWSLLMVLVVIVNWLITLVAGRSPRALHGFTAAYIKYLTQLFAYLLLAANPYPLFTGTEDYPIDLEIDPPAPQSRLVTLFRIVLALPVLVLEAVFLGTFAGGGETYSGRAGESDVSYSTGGATVGILWTVAFLGWFACLVLGRMPLGFRNLQAYGLRYCAQVWSYFFLLTDRYPNLDPADPVSTGPVHPVGLIVTDDLRRSRLTVFFRFLLALPHFVWLILWTTVAWLAAIANWFATLFAGRSPAPLHRFLSAYLRYTVHLYSFVALTANPFPGFTGAAGSYPVDPELPGSEPQRRLVTAFRLILAFPALAVSGSLYGLTIVTALFGWFISLALGRMPRSFREAQAYTFRYGAQVSAYVLILTDRYPFSGPSLGQPEPTFVAVPEPELPPEPFESPAPA
jgi:Domain of unknown function (DUF4389)